MKERPALFNTPMVQAILEGRKTQTRRVVKPQPVYWQYAQSSKYPGRNVAHYTWEKDGAPARGCEPFEYIPFCPYGEPGDRLWVKETFFPLTRGCAYRADGLVNENFPGLKWKPSIFMPRKASRILLENAARDFVDQNGTKPGWWIQALKERGL